MENFSYIRNKKSMKKYYVYELINLYGSVEYVGETTRPYARFAEHTKYNKKSKVFGRSDVFMNIVKEFKDRKSAFAYQVELQKEYGHITDSEKLTRKHTDETKQKIAKQSKGRWTGKTHSLESKLLMSEKRRLYWQRKKNKL